MVCPEACCALRLETVLFIHRSEKNNVLNIFPTWLEVESMVLLTLGSENKRLKKGV